MLWYQLVFQINVCTLSSYFNYCSHHWQSTYYTILTSTTTIISSRVVCSAANVTTGAISHAKPQSNHHHQQTNIQFFTGRMPFLSPNQQCQSTKGKISHSMDLLTPSSSGGLTTLSLTTNSSWLPWGEVCHSSHQPSDTSTPVVHTTQ